MARIRKENINTSFFHIMVQGNNKDYIFNSEKDIYEYIKIMKETKEKNDIIILAYCIMNNHAHMLINEENVENLTKYMHRVNLIYAKYYNKKYDRVGYVFRDRYKTQPIYSEKHLHACVRYIHNNPVKAGICRNANEYKYSSCYKNIFYTNTEIEKKIRKIVNTNKENESREEQEFIFMENEANSEEQCKNILAEILTQNNITKKEFYENEKLINSTIRRLKIENNISYRAMENILGINRKRLRKIEKSFMAREE